MGQNTDKGHAVIAGGGIAGLSSAICLSLQGWRVSVFEQSSNFENIGAGVQISPNGSRVLQQMGVLDHLKDSWFEPLALELRHGRSNRRLLYLPMAEVATERWGGRYLHVYRPDLIAAFLQVIENCNDVSITTDCRVTGYDQTDSKVSVALSNSAAVEADLLVAADGVHSGIRTQMTGDDGARFTGNVAWRALIPADRLSNPPPMTACVWTGEGKHAVTTRVRSGSWVNFVGVVEQDNWQEEGWRLPGTVSQALDDFGNWNNTLSEIIKSSDELYRWALLDRPPLNQWSDKAVVLIGDAAHAMLPSMAQGAVQCIEDAWVLATCHQQLRETQHANQRFYQQRFPRTRRIQQQSAANLRLFHKRGKIRQLVGYTPVWIAGKLLPSAVYRRNDWVYGEGPV